MTTQGENRPFDIGCTIGRAFALIGRYPIKVMGLALLIGAGPTRALYYVLSTDQPTRGSIILHSLAEIIAALLIQTVLAGLLIGSATRQDAGIGPGARRLPSLIGAGLLNGIGSVIAMICLLIPYLFVLTRWSVVGAVLGNENRGISEAFGRSSELTEGVRWRIFGLILLSAVGQALLLMVGMLLVTPFTGTLVAGQEFTLNPFALTMRLAIETCTIGFGAALQCALYVALRERRDGPKTDQLTEIFA